MKIALVGYGKMGKAIEKMALEQGHKISLIVDDKEEKIDFNDTEVVIEFSTPEAAFHNIKTALEQGLPVVSGTTGWLERYDEIVNICNAYKTSFLYASNFSLGVNIFFEINKKLAQLMQGLDYEVSISEIHHIQKLDAPSGTAITLAEQIVPYSNKKNWSLDKNDKNSIPIKAHRIEDVTGTHRVLYESEVDNIYIQHQAKNRLGFVKGALLAAAFIKDKKGVFTMKDVLGI